MPPRPVARDKVLDAFEQLLLSKGERAATMDAIAGLAGVSKGGLIYHFASREALIEGLEERCRARGQEYLHAMTAAPEGPVAFFLRTSAVVDSPFDRTLVATNRLRSHPKARDVLVWLQRQWYEALLAVVVDPNLARTIMLISDGLYFNAAGADGALPDPGLGEGTIDGVLELVDQLVRETRAPTG
jgi:AcrR family transcriptional regulator